MKEKKGDRKKINNATTESRNIEIMKSILRYMKLFFKIKIKKVETIYINKTPPLKILLGKISDLIYGMIILTIIQNFWNKYWLFINIICNTINK